MGSGVAEGHVPPTILFLMLRNEDVQGYVIAVKNMRKKKIEFLQWPTELPAR